MNIGFIPSFHPRPSITLLSSLSIHCSNWHQRCFTSRPLITFSWLCLFKPPGGCIKVISFVHQSFFDVTTWSYQSLCGFCQLRKDCTHHQPVCFHQVGFESFAQSSFDVFLWGILFQSYGIRFSYLQRIYIPQDHRVFSFLLRFRGLFLPCKKLWLLHYLLEGQWVFLTCIVPIIPYTLTMGDILSVCFTRRAMIRRSFHHLHHPLYILSRQEYKWYHYWEGQVKEVSWPRHIC